MRHVLITGATRGIGKACSEYFTAREWAVTAVARTVSDLDGMQQQWSEHYPGRRLHTVTADLATAVGVNAIPATNYDAIILNAGAYRPGRLVDEEDVFTSLLQLNLLGNYRLARRLLPALVQEGHGHLVLLGSTGTDDWLPHMTAYTASKYALRGLFLGLEKDLMGTGVRCSLIAPAATLTSSWDDEPEVPENILPPETVARAVWEAVTGGRTGRIVVK